LVQESLVFGCGIEFEKIFRFGDELFVHDFLDLLGLIDGVFFLWELGILSFGGYFISFAVSDLLGIGGKDFDFGVRVDFAGIVPGVGNVEEVLGGKLLVILDRVCG
jgi:hypothetical protein